ncbi:hypothetical protein QBC38DRAFT_371210 [Podospora fimiseda]|uniref:Uncharacterized protein n=1 Tax=Podospora fimiseda TaxID=252190 RepID=A0AAN7BJE2_9PEZI|nr:hypothetical protein QBC38DRAFT_371210 [Podospora fimiseda]
MCKFIQRQYSCRHLRFIAASWCVDYTVTHIRCPPNVAHFESVEDICGDCKLKMAPPAPWEHMIKRKNKQEGSSSSVEKD